MFNNKLLLFLFILLNCTLSRSQEKETKFELNLLSAVSNQDALPFWIQSNRNGMFASENFGLLNTHLASKNNSFFKNTTFDYGLSLSGLIASENKLIINELFTQINIKKIQVKLGVFNEQADYNGLSSSNGNILWSGNARALPGYKIKTDGFVNVPFATSWLQFKFSYGDYKMNDTRTVKNTLLHAKQLHFKFKLNNRSSFIAGLNHFAQWNGTSDTFGAQPDGFKNYINIVLGREGSSDATLGDQINALGNHLGSYLFKYEQQNKARYWSIYYSHLFEDRSGREFMNYPDALYGFYIDFKRPKALVSHLLTEITYTKHHSGSTPHFTDPDGTIHARSGLDNYFNNGMYESGWTYFGRTIGSPFFTPRLPDENGITKGIIPGQNRFISYHIGLSGMLQNFQYKTMLSHVSYAGWFTGEFMQKSKQFSALFELVVPPIQALPFELSAAIAFDANTTIPNNFGGFLKISKRIGSRPEASGSGGNRD